MEKRKVLQIVGDNIKTLLREQGISSTQLAKKCRVSSGSISKIINGNMSITIPMAVTLAEGLETDVNTILKGLSITQIEGNSKKTAPENIFSIGVLSINNKRITCVKNSEDIVIGTSELVGGLDLAESSANLMNLIQEAIYAALPKDNHLITLKNARLNLVTQSYEFEETREKFIFFAKRHFKEVLLMSDWQITYLAAFEKKPGISLITDKGVSLSYIDNHVLKKLGGWKFPIYDLGGENWLGVEAIRHTVEAAEGYIPMSKLAQNILAKFNGKIEKMTEACFKGERNPDIYCIFADLLLRSYLANDTAARLILENGFKHIFKAIEKVDSISAEKRLIALDGSLADVYRPFFDSSRLITPSSEADKACLLASLTEQIWDEL